MAETESEKKSTNTATSKRMIKQIKVNEKRRMVVDKKMYVWREEKKGEGAKDENRERERAKSNGPCPTAAPSKANGTTKTQLSLRSGDRPILTTETLSMSQDSFNARES